MDTIKITKCDYINSDMIFQGESVPDISGKQIFIASPMERTVYIDSVQYKIDCPANIWIALVDKHFKRIVKVSLENLDSGAHQKIKSTQFPDYKLFIDDERWPALTDWVIARTPRQAIEAVEHYGIPKKISFDYDLGTTSDGKNLTVIEFIDWLENGLELDHFEIPKDFEYCVISNNEKGAEEIRNRMESILMLYTYLNDALFD